MSHRDPTLDAVIQAEERSIEEELAEHFADDREAARTLLFGMKDRHGVTHGGLGGLVMHQLQNHKRFKCALVPRQRRHEGVRAALALALERHDQVVYTPGRTAMKCVIYLLTACTRDAARAVTHESLWNHLTYSGAPDWVVDRIRELHRAGMSIDEILADFQANHPKSVPAWEIVNNVVTGRGLYASDHKLARLFASAGDGPADKALKRDNWNSIKRVAAAVDFTPYQKRVVANAIGNALRRLDDQPCPHEIAPDSKTIKALEKKLGPGLKAIGLTFEDIAPADWNALDKFAFAPGSSLRHHISRGHGPDDDSSQESGFTAHLTYSTETRGLKALHGEDKTDVDRGQRVEWTAPEDDTFNSTDQEETE